ncbi:hypothetical protein F3Y22_tig00110893pilonHSYRG01359 [Hibiscus syriacus]|uniref:At4g15545-like C-terminal domain-containing protein n=1 Tax=Hibiscus syriacus TaxID=106335 RepID=A0A6A2ZJP2_HIBSY|nr:hypothetical protein F3Y22_tig00110893pilonHSYRG01359 [Hibiscus syriacus]
MVGLHPRGTCQASSHPRLALLLDGIHCQHGVLESMGRNSFVKPGVSFRMNSSVLFGKHQGTECSKANSREEALSKAEEIFGADNKDLLISFQGLLNRSIR